MDNPQKRHRRSIRLAGYDYRIAGSYFVTLCTQRRLCLFGDIVHGEMILNDAGQMLHRVWEDLPHFYPGVDIDAFQIMPNHVHGIIILAGAPPHDSTPTTPIVGAGPRACPPPDTGQQQDVGQSRNTGQPRAVAPTKVDEVFPRGIGQARGPAPMGMAGGGYENKTGVGLSLPDVVHRFKTMTTKKYADGVKQSGWPAFPGKLWQRNYYERVIRDIDELVQIQQYILDNPQKWEFDRENPQCLVLDTLQPVYKRAGEG